MIWGVICAIIRAINMNRGYAQGGKIKGASAATITRRLRRRRRIGRKTHREWRRKGKPGLHVGDDCSDQVGPADGSSNNLGERADGIVVHVMSLKRYVETQVTESAGAAKVEGVVGASRPSEDRARGRMRKGLERTADGGDGLQHAVVEIGDFRSPDPAFAPPHHLAKGERWRSAANHEITGVVLVAWKGAAHGERVPRQQIRDKRATAWTYKG